MSNASFHEAYPVAAASGRRRRLLALRSAVGFEPIPEEIDPELREHSADSEPAEASDRDSADTPVDRLRHLVDDPAPRTWLFAGDRLGFGSKHARRGWIEHFSDVVRGHLARSLDVVLDTTTDEARCDRLLRNLDWRILRFQPDVVLLMPGPGEVSQLAFDEARFGEILSNLVARLREEGCEVVLCTLPPLKSTSKELRQRLESLAHHVRTVAADSETVLVDHARHWKTAANPERKDSRLLDRSGTRPTAFGHQQLARNLIRALRLPLS